MSSGIEHQWKEGSTTRTLCGQWITGSLREEWGKVTKCPDCFHQTKKSKVKAVPFW